MIKVYFEDNRCVKCDDVNEIIDAIIKEYRNNCDVCIGEMLCSVIIDRLPIDTILDIYGRVIYEIEGDELIHIRDGEETIRIL